MSISILSVFGVAIYRNMRYSYVMKNTQATSVRLSPKAKQLLQRLAAQAGISQSAILELAIREKAEKAGVHACRC
jgi:Ribbon-helix-helix protein, copG family